MNWTINQTVDLSRGYTPVVWPDALMVSGDVGAHTWRLTVLDNGVPADLSGATITGNFLRDDGATVQVAGSKSGNVASVTLTDACYAVEGKLVGTMRAVISGATVTLAAVVYTVKLLTSGDVVDPGVTYQDFTIDASPAGTYADLAALISADPDHSKIYITLNDGNWCYHNGTTFVAGGVYQATSIADGAVTPEKTSFVAPFGKNLFNYRTITPGSAMCSSTGLPTDASSFTLSDFMPVVAGEAYTFPFYSVNLVAWYNSGKTFIKREAQAEFNTAPATAAFSRIAYHVNTNVPLELIQFEQGGTQTDFEPWGSVAKETDIANVERVNIYQNKIIVRRQPGSGLQSNFAEIYIPTLKPKTYIRWQLSRETNADPEQNVDVWRTAECAVYTRDGMGFTRQHALTTIGEFDCALRISGAPDFIGGLQHGDEKMNVGEVWLVDGLPYGMAAVAEQPRLCDEVRLTVSANMYDPSDHTTYVGIHYKEWIFTTAGLELRQRVVWSVPLTMKHSYLAMMPCLRKFPYTTGTQITDRGYNNFDYVHYDLSQDANASAITAHREGVTRQVVYSSTDGVLMECEVEQKPNLPGSTAFISDAVSYNKMYFSFCPSDYQVQAGEVWENVSRYKIVYG